LNAFRIDKDDEPAESREAEETLEMSDDGGVKSEDDEEIDSDEAFDESDDEKYSSFKFSGSSSKTVKV
jgi:U3 small nucleolar RNA-associated protein 14